MTTTETAMQRIYKDVKKGIRGFQVESVRPHLDILSAYASQCRSVTEFGVGSGCVTVAFLLSGCKRVIGYDVVMTPTALHVQHLAAQEGLRCKLICKNVLKVKIARTDLLFIDTDHWYGQLRDELQLHHRRVRKWILLHSTETFGLMNPFDGRPGMKAAMYEFMEEHPEWQIREHIQTGHGLTVLEKVSRSSARSRNSEED
jgi:hypothetical protein